ncbi:MAG: hypothetical protein ACUVRX_04650 [Actinomycetota bacterium]
MLISLSCSTLWQNKQIREEEKGEEAIEGQKDNLSWSPLQIGEVGGGRVLGEGGRVRDLPRGDRR